MIYSTLILNDIISDTYWTVENSPYLIQKDIFVKEGAILTIEPGVIVKFGGIEGSSAGLTLRDNSSLVAKGTPSSLIYFTDYRNDEMGGDTNNDGDETSFPLDGTGTYQGSYHAIGNQGSGLLSLQYVHAKFMASIQQVDLSKSGTGRLEIKNSLIEQCSTAVYVHGDSAPDTALLNKVEIRDCATGINMCGKVVVDVVNSLFYGLGVAVRINSNVGGCDSVAEDITISGSVFEGNEYALRAQDGNEDGISNIVIDVRNNWWDDSSGPTYSSNPEKILNPDGKGQKIFNYGLADVLFTPWLTVRPTIDIWNEDILQCSDGIDNDKDELTDWNDIGCQDGGDTESKIQVTLPVIDGDLGTFEYSPTLENAASTGMSEGDVLIHYFGQYPNTEYVLGKVNYPTAFTVLNDFEWSGYSVIPDSCGGGEIPATGEFWGKVVVQGTTYYWRLWKKDGEWFPEPPLDKTIDSLKQFKSDGKTPLEDKGITAGDTVVFKARVDPLSDRDLKLQVEVQKYPDAFMSDPDTDDVLLLNSDFVPAGGVAAATSTILEDGEYHWRARAVSKAGSVSDWQYYEGVEDHDLRIKTVPLYTQGKSEYPSLVDTEGWFEKDYAFASSTVIGTHYSCGYSIAHCGCSVTSVIMMLRYYNITEDVEDNDVNPGTINEWLKNPKDYKGNDLIGYTPSGDLWWSAVDEYSRDPGVLNPFVRKERISFIGQYYAGEKTTEFLNDDLASSTPVILQTKTPATSGGLITHYILATEKLADTYRVNDSYWYNTETLNEKITTEEDNMPYDNYKRDYNNNYVSIDRYAYLGLNVSTHIPNILLMLASPAELLVIAPDGKKLGYDPVNDIRYDEIEEGSYGSSSLGGPESPSTSSHETKTIWIPNPLPGEYKIQVIGTGEGEYHLYSQNKDTKGDFKADNFVSNITQGETLEYLLDYNPENIDESEIIPLIVDTTPPEAKIYFDTEKEKMLVIGIDDITENPEVSVEENCTKEIQGKCLKKEYVYTITDNVGNTLKLWMEKITHKNNILARIKKIQYNEDEPIDTKASLHYVWKKDQDNNMKFLSQVLKDQQNFVLNANYHLQKDETKISGYDQEKRQVIRENLSGLTIINLLIEQGQFQYEY